MNVKWIEKHTLEISEERLKEMARDMDEYAKPYGWNIVEHVLDNEMHNEEGPYHKSEIIGFDDIVDKVTEVVRRYRDETSNQM